MTQSAKVTSETAVMDKVIRVIADVMSVSPDLLSPGTSIRTDLGADSMQIVTVVIALDTEFDAEFNVDEIPSGDVTIEWVCKMVQSVLSRVR